MDEVEAFARARKRKVRTRLLVIGAVIAAPFAYLGWRFYQGVSAEDERRAEFRRSLELSGPARDSLRTAVAEARRVRTTAREAWTRAVSPETLAAAAPGTEPCPFRIAASTAEAAERYIRHANLDGSYFGAVSFRRHAAGAPIPPLALDAELKQLERIAAELEAGTADRNDATHVHSLQDGAVLVITERVIEPLVSSSLGAADTETGSFTPGRVVGTAYVYSYREQRITCAGPLDVTNGDSIRFDVSYMRDSAFDKETKVEEGARAMLRRDLDIRTQQALAPSLRAVTATAAPSAP